MKPTKIFWQIFPATLFILLFSIISLTWYGTSSIEAFFIKQAKLDLKAQTQLVAARVIELAQRGEMEKLRDYVLHSGRTVGTRFTVIEKSGKVVADSSHNPDQMNNHAERPEIRTVLDAGQSAFAIRYSVTVQDDLLYVAMPFSFNGTDGQEQLFIIRASYSIASIFDAISHIKRQVAIGSLIIVFIAIFITLLLTRNISRPLEELRTWAEKLSRRDFSAHHVNKLKHRPLQESNACLEVVSLAQSMDEMGLALKEHIETINSHRGQLETVFSSMQEALIAVDNNLHILAINEAAIRLFSLQKPPTKKTYIHEISRNTEFLNIINSVIEDGLPIEEEIEFFHGDASLSHLHTKAVLLRDSNRVSLGVLIVLNDVTRIRQLETVRQDFVANVSHELRTPITAIQGYTELLLDDEMHDPQDSKQFLQIIFRQSKRLSAIIEDLLALSRIEKDSQTDSIVFVEEDLYQILEAAVQTCRMEAEAKSITLSLECITELRLPLNAPLLEQAIVNLIVNAIRYSPQAARVTIRAQKNEQEMHIAVIDQGCGINAEHLPRLFERFYRSDKARSRTLGGTGLGLAIVKHIVQAHGGRVEVISQLGEGSTFSISLPMPQ